MTLPLRRALALLFAALFIIIAPLSVAYGRGYRFDTSTRRIRLTGVIFLAGSPNRVQVTVDDGKPRNLSLPTTLRGLLPTTHTLTIAAAGYSSQVFTLNVRSGQTTFATALQLYQTQPFTTIRTGIPNTAQLAPNGSAVAWLQAHSLAIASPSGIKQLALITKVESLTWSENSENILLQDENRATVAVVSKAGAFRDAAYVVSAIDRLKVDELLNHRMIYKSLQRIPNSANWLLVDESSAWVLRPDGELTLATRWGNAIINAVHLGGDSLATVRREEVLVRNIDNGQTALYEIPNLTQASAGIHEGELNLLVADGDLLQWQRGIIF